MEVSKNINNLNNVVLTSVSRFPGALFTIWIGNIIHFSLLMIWGNITTGNPPEIEWEGIARFSLTSVIFINVLAFAYSGAIIFWQIIFIGSFLIIQLRPSKWIYRLLAFLVIAIASTVQVISLYSWTDRAFIFIVTNVFVIAFMFLFSEFWFKKVYRRGQRKRAEGEAKASPQTNTPLDNRLPDATY